jgi:hypothetical protein
MEQSHQPERSDSALESLEHELYDPKNKMDDISVHRVRGGHTTELPTSWGDNAPIITQGKEEGGISFGAKLLLVSCMFLFAALGFLAWRFFSSGNMVSPANIDMSLEITPYVEGGESVPATFTLLNRNTSALQDAVITLEYKKGVGSQDEEEKVREKRDIGIINQNDNKRQDFNIVLYGGEAEQRDLTVKLEYKVVGSNNVFNKVITQSVVLKAPQIAVHIEGPTILSVGQSGVFDVTVKNNSATTSLPSVLQIILPNTFAITNTEPKLTLRSPIWSIHPLAPGNSQTIKITGSLGGTQGETTSMKALVGSESDTPSSIGIVYSSHVVDIKLRSSPLNFAVTLDAASGATDKIRYGDTSTLTITYVNTSDVALQDVEMQLALFGDAPLYKKIDPGEGYYDSIKKVITWNKITVPGLATLAPRASGSFKVTVPIVTSGSNSPIFKLTLSGAANSQSVGDVVAALSKSWVVEGSATINAKVLYKNSAFVNTGPIPPVVNTETTYTVHLLVSAQNALNNARVSFRLPPYVSWRNITTDPSRISFDTKTQTATWLIGNIAAEKTEIIDIGLSVKPSQSHVNQMPSITSGIVLDADEEISRVHIRTALSPLTTYIAEENWNIDPSRVVDR